MRKLYLSILLLVFLSLQKMEAQDRSTLNYKNPNIPYTGDANRVVKNLAAGKALMKSAAYKYVSIAVFTSGALATYGIARSNISDNTNGINLVMGNLGVFYAQQTFNALSAHQLVVVGKALLADENFQLDNLSNPEKKIQVSKLMKNHPGNLLIKAGRKLKTGAYINMISPLAGMGGLFYVQNSYNSNIESQDYAIAAAASGGVTMVSIGSILDFSAHGKMAKAGKILQNHTATNISYAGKQLKQGARLHKWIYVVPFLTGAALIGNVYLNRNSTSNESDAVGYYAIAYAGCGAMFTLDIVSTAKLRKAGKALTGE